MAVHFPWGFARRSAATAAIFAASALLASPARADAAHSTKISVPKGPGSIEGLGSTDFAPALPTGTSAYSIPILVPPGSGGLGPLLSLSYDSGGGVSEVGLGWRLAGVPRVRRRVHDGLPRFDDSDSFELEGLGLPSELLEMPDGFLRPRYDDGSLVRVSRSRNGAEWEARTKAGGIFRFGGDGFEEAEGNRTAAYLLREQRDRHGHRIAYEWRTDEGHSLLVRVTWNDFDDAARNEVTFDYEDRPDHYRRYSSGIEELLTRRLRTVEVTHGGELVRRYDLTYDDGLHPALETLTLVGRDGKTALPAARFEYTQPKFEANAEQVVRMKRPPGLSPSAQNAALTDLDGDGLPDLLLGTAGNYRSYLNHDGKSWRAGRDWGPMKSPSTSLAASGVQLADVDGDGASDLLVKSGRDSFRYLPGGIAAFATAVPISPVPSFTFEDADVRVADMDGDRRADVIVTTAAGLAVGYRQGDGWTEPEFVGEPVRGVRFSDGHTSLCDVNGDRIQDLCQLRSEAMEYRLGRGRGVFEAPKRAKHVPEFNASAPFTFEDLNGDGWIDLVQAGVNSVRYALAIAEGDFDEVRLIENTPARGPHTTVHHADLNGSGTVDILWVDVTGADEASWRYLELFPEGKAGLLRRIDSGLGKVQTIDYAPAALDAAAARDARSPWKTRMNIAMPVVRRVTVDASLGDPPVTSEYTYGDGAYDPKEHGFAGFGTAVERELGDEWTPTLVTESSFDTGLLARVLRGAPLGKELRDSKGIVFMREHHEHESRAVARARNGVAVELSIRRSSEVEHVEGSSGRTTRTEYEVDDHGNVGEERRWGDVATEGDEAFLLRTYAEDESDWLLGFLATETLSDGTGTRVSQMRKYYDGQDFQGLALGRVTRGDLSREEAWVGPDGNDFELEVATRYDTDGHPIETRDARGGGRTFEWAPDRTSIRSEAVRVGEDRVLIERAEVDGAFGTLTSVTEYNGQTTRFSYDPFGRLADVIRPGDTTELPTTRYTYVPGAPLSRIITELRVESDEAAVDRSVTLQDGLGRSRGALTADGSDIFLAGVHLYDARGNPRRALLPRRVPANTATTALVTDDAPRGTDTWRDAMGRAARTRSLSGVESRTEYAPLETRHWDGGQNDRESPYEHKPTVTRSDGLGRTIEHIQTLNGKTLSASYAYDAASALLSRTDPGGATSRYRYDGRGRRVLVSDPDLGKHRFSYDATGNLTGHVYPDGKNAQFTYDLAGRSLTEDANGDGNPDSTRFWDEDQNGDRDPLYLGKLVEITGESGSSRHTFDARGRIVGTSLRIGDAAYSVGSVFDAQDRERTHVYPDGSSVEIQRNGRGQISGYGRAISLEYGEDGLETARRFSTGVEAVTDYDKDRRRSVLRVTSKSGGVIEDLRWQYDAGGNLTAVEDRRSDVTRAEDRSERYTYDNFYRLSGVTGAWGTATYRYSPSGSLLSRESSVASQNIGKIRYAERPHAPVAFDDRVVEYDARGRTQSDGERVYTWNDSDELARVEIPGGASETNTYDGEGKRRIRLERTPDGIETTTHFIDAWSEVKDGKLRRYIVHGDQRIVRLASAGKIASEGGLSAATLAALHPIAVLLPLLLLVALLTRLASKGRHLAVAVCAVVVFAVSLAACNHDAPAGTPASAGPVAELTDDDTLLSTDLLGSLLGETSGTGKVTGRFSAYPYGATRYDTSGESHQYAAVPRDEGVGLDAMGARYYAPAHNIFTSADPIGITAPERLITEDFAAANPYAYAKNSPLIAADRDGHFWHIAVGAAIGALAGGGIEAARQLYTTGRISEPGRIVSSAVGGAVSGALVAANPVAGLSAKLGVEAGAGAAGGIASRIVDSGGKSAGTVTDAVLDAGISAVTAGTVKGGAALVKGVGKNAVKQLAQKLPRFNGPKPKYHVNEAHVTGPRFNPKKDPLPSDAADVYKKAVPDAAEGAKNWYGKNVEGLVYRFSNGGDGTAHFSGSSASPDGIRNITPYAVKRLEEGSDAVR